MRIQQLAPAIANQIAAGEVIERPASVVKELLENALDANATNITIEIGYGGLNQIKVSDNGIGILAEDLPLAIAAHATSKITQLNDLYAIDSMGFRGEALASIASVAKLTLSSKPAEQTHAMMLEIQDSNECIKPCARSQGTTVDIQDLFFNAPVRKRFLKSEKLEFQAIEGVVKRFALSAPHIAIHLKHNGKEVFSLPAAISESIKHQRMTKILGHAFMKESIFLDVELSGLSLRGWISSPKFQRSQNDKLWVYINKRMVKDKLIHHAIKQTYDAVLHPGRFPSCLLYFSINTAEVDVNVHPTKHEVRFQQPRLVHDFFTSQLSKALLVQVEQPVETNYSLDLDCSLKANTDICEPNTFVKQKNTELSVYDHQPKAPWIELSDEFVLIILQQQPYIVNAIALYQHWLQKQLNLQTLPFKNRPLLVPLSYNLPAHFEHQKEEFSNVLNQLGLELQWISNDKLIVRSLPIKAPHLDITLLLDSLSSMQCLDLNLAIQSLIKSQLISINHLSSEERMELNQLLFNDSLIYLKKQGLCKELTAHDCRKLLNV